MIERLGHLSDHILNRHIRPVYSTRKLDNDLNAAGGFLCRNPSARQIAALGIHHLCQFELNVFRYNSGQAVVEFCVNALHLCPVLGRVRAGFQNLLRRSRRKQDGLLRSGLSLCNSLANDWLCPNGCDIFGNSLCNNSRLGINRSNRGDRTNGCHIFR